jgi:hypothetical protein
VSELTQVDTERGAGGPPSVGTSVVIVAYESGPALTRCLHLLEPEVNGEARTSLWSTTATAAPKLKKPSA